MPEIPPFENLYSICKIHVCVPPPPISLKPGSELDNLEEILDDLQNSQLSQHFPGASTGSVDKQAIINDLMQITGENSPGTPVGAQKPTMRISQSSESELLDNSKNKANYCGLGGGM